MTIKQIKKAIEENISNSILTFEGFNSKRDTELKNELLHALKDKYSRPKDTDKKRIDRAGKTKEAEAYLQRGIHPVDNGKYVRRLVLEELDHFCDRYAPLVPKQYISYQRSAFFGKDNSNFRLTFDRQITARREDLSLSSGNYGIQLIRPDQRLMEIKVTDSIPKWLSDALSELNIYKTSFSKYGTAYKQFIQSKIEEDRSVMIYA